MAKPRFYYDNRLDDAVPVASSTAAGDFNVLNLRDWRPFTWWKPNAMPGTVTVDCGAAKAADYALVYGHTLFTAGATVNIRGSTDNFAASNVLVATSTPASNDPILFSFASQAFRYWRVEVTGAAAPSLAIAAIGAMLEATVYLDGMFNPADRIPQGQVNTNENGAPIGSAILFESWSAQILLPNVTWSWARNTFIPAWKARLRGTPFGFCWEADLYPGDIRLVMAPADGTGGLLIPHRAGSLCDVQLNVQGVAQ